MPTLFETFSDLDDASASKYGGAGLGLPLAHRLCGLMDAELSVRTSRAGTSVSVILPVAGTESKFAGASDARLARAA
jgi:signal transduction histidine kinase